MYHWYIGNFLSAAAEPALAANAPSLVAAHTFSVLAGSIVTNGGPTAIPGNLGVSPTIGVPPHVTGFPPGSVGPPGTIHDGDQAAAAAQADDTAAFAFLDQTPCTAPYVFGASHDLAGASLAPGIYCADAFTLSGGGTLTLTGNGVWIFKSASTLITSTGSSVVGTDPCNVWWRVVSSATIEVGTAFIGNILALTSITLKTGATLNGRALAQTGEVSLDSNPITSNCGTLNGGQTGAFNGIGPGGFTIVPEYPSGVFVLLILMLPAYMLLKRRNRIQ